MRRNSWSVLYSEKHGGERDAGNSNEDSTELNDLLDKGGMNEEKKSPTFLQVFFYSR